MDFKKDYSFDKKEKKALKYTKNDFVYDVTTRLTPLLSNQDTNNLSNVISKSWDTMMDNSKVLLVNKYVFSSSMYALDEVLMDLKYNPSTNVDYGSVRGFRKGLDKEIEKDDMHRFILVPLLMEVFKDIEFKLSKDKNKWTGLEFGQACVGGFGDRTKHKNLKYDTQEQGYELKETILTALAVYFMDLLLSKQTKL